MEQNEYSVICALFFIILTVFVPYINSTTTSIHPNKLVSYSIPDSRPLKKALGFNEDIYLNFTELTNKYKYPTEVHTVTTEDGYILTVFRILSKCSESVEPYPVLLMHGIMDTSDTWIVSGTKIGLGYVLADNCYDVWVANSRGNYYSRRHISLDPNKDVAYWNFSFDENGNFDIPATIDYILEKTGHAQLFFVGHSQGSTNYFVMSSLRPNYNDKIRLAIQLGPIAWLRNMSNPLIVIASQNYMAIKIILEEAGFRELLARDHIVNFLVQFLCETAPRVCEFGLYIATNYTQGIPLKDIPVTVGHTFSGCSVKTLAHYAQIVLTDKFQRYDEGRKGNIQRYGSLKPPEYNLSLINSPVILISGSSDTLSPIVNVNRLASNLPRLIEYYIVPEPYWSHNNHLWGSMAPNLIHPKILDYFNRYKMIQ